MSLAKLTAVATKTLSLLLERQRLSSLSSYSTDNPTQSGGSSLHYPQIKKNLNQLRQGIQELEAKAKAGNATEAEAAKLLRSQYDRMRGMLWEEERAEIPGLDPLPTKSEPPSQDSRPSGPSHTSTRDSLFSGPASFAPYTDEPDHTTTEQEPAALLQVQRQIMDNQDHQLDQLSHSINRQHHISLQINDELDVHHGLLQELDTSIDRTDSRLRKARRKLDTVARGVKQNASVVTIGVLIFVLLILIIKFKT